MNRPGGVEPAAANLLVCHVAATAGALQQAGTLGLHGDLDLLVYGQGSQLFPAPAGTVRVRLPEFRRSPLVVWETARWILGIRRRRYGTVVIGQPELRRSRARGVFLALPTILGAKRGGIVDPAGREPARAVRRSAAAIDFVIWAGLQVASQLLATAAAGAIGLILRRRSRAAREIPAQGSVVYLRTDVDIVCEGLRAGGSAAHTEGIVRALRAEGFPTELWSTGEIAGIPRERRLHVLAHANVPTEILELTSVARQIGSVLRHRRVDGFVYQRYSLNNLLGLFAARWWRVPLVLEVNASEVQWRRQWSRLRFGGLAQATERLLLARADRIVAVSGNAGAELIAMGAPPERMRVVPNGVDVSWFASAEPAALPFASGSLVIAFCGLFYPWHGAPVLARAFAELATEQPHARLLLVGDGGELPAVERILADAAVAERVHVTGMVDRSDVPGYMRAADILVSPHADVAGFIGSPIKVFEYMAAGRAIVATRVGQIPEILDDEHTALLVPPDEPVQLAAALIRLARDPQLRIRLGENAQAEAMHQHSWGARVRESLERPR